MVSGVVEETEVRIRDSGDGKARAGDKRNCMVNGELLSSFSPPPAFCFLPTAN
jgi:hypothetical protein